MVFVVCFGAYVGNGDFIPASDPHGNMLFSVNLLKRHSLSLGPPNAPDAFTWRLESPGSDPRGVRFDGWSPKIRDLYDKGRLKPTNRYFLVETRHPGVYVNTFGIGTSIVALPVYALLDLFTDIETDRYWWWHGGALAASLLVALTALLVFLTARRFVSPSPAFLTAMAFGLGSCVWPISSQGLWQHPSSTFFLGLGTYFLLTDPDRARRAGYCGAALGMAVWCRPTNAVVVICIGAWLLWVNRRRFTAYVAGGLPFAVLLMVYNEYYFDNPFQFGQTIASRVLALERGLPDDLWTGPLWESLPGLLVSPSRGLIFYSPVLLFGFAGAVLCWRTPRYHSLIPLQAATVLLFVVAAKWFEWWGGSIYGYRTIVDTTVFLALLMIPVMERVAAGRRELALFCILLLWSAAVQFVGAWSYSVVGWTSQWAAYKDPDKASLWRWSRPQIAYHVANFRSERALKRRVMQAYVDRKGPVLYPSHSPPARASGQPPPSRKDLNK